MTAKTNYILLFIFLIVLSGCKTESHIIGPSNTLHGDANYLIDASNGFIYPNNALSYYECAQNKREVIDICRAMRRNDECTLKLCMIYAMYLYKTGEKTDFTALDLLIREGMVNITDFPYDLDAVLDDLHNAINNNGAASVLSEEFNLIKNIGADKTLDKASPHKSKYFYFKNILEYANAKNIQDCDNIIIYKEHPNDLSPLLMDACRLTFVFDKKRFCQPLFELP